MKFFKEIANEASLGDYRKKAAMQRAQAQMGAMFARDPEERKKNLDTFNKRDAGLNRVKARDEKARADAQAQQLANDIAQLPELRAKYDEMRAKYKSLGGSDWQYADREQNLTPAEREARSMEGPMNNLWRQISAAEKAQQAQGVTEGRSSEDLPMYGAIIHRIMVAHTDVLAKYGPEKIMAAAEDEAEWVGDVEEIGTSDVSISVKRVIQSLEEQNNVTEGGFKNMYAEFSGYGNYMQGRAVNVFSKFGLEIVSKEYTEDDDIQTYVVKGDRWSIEKAGKFLERNPDEYGGYHFVKQDVKEGSESPESELERLKLRQNAWEKAPLRDQAATQARIRELEKQIKDKENIKEADMNTGNQGYDNMLAVMKAVDAGQDATFNLAGEPITLEYPEARFLAGKYKAFLRAGRQEEFLKYMNNPVAFDRLMKQLRDLIDKQKNFRGSVPGERGVDEAAPAMAKLAGGLGVGLVAAAGAPAIVGILGPLLGIPMAAYGAYSAAKLGMKGVEQLWDMATEKLGSSEEVEQYANAQIAKLPQDQAQAAQAVIKQVAESKKATELPVVAEGHYYCKLSKTAKLIPEGYKKTASGYITRL